MDTGSSSCPESQDRPTYQDPVQRAVMSMTDGIDERPRSYPRVPQAALAQSTTAVMTRGRESAYLHLFVNNVASSSTQFLPVLGVSELMHLDLEPNLGKYRVALRLPETWRVWRGYQLSGWTHGDLSGSLSTNWSPGSWSRLDPMDADHYDDSCAFPRDKPSFDVFPPPHRTRKQRGWFQATRSALNPRPATSVLYPTCSPAYANGSELPSELLQQILHELGADPFVSQHDRGSCSLVCRHWADVMRPHIFQDIRISSRERLMSFAAFIRNPVSRAMTYIDRVTLAPTVLPETTPFLHLMKVHVSTVGTAATPREITIQLTITGPLPPRYPNTVHSIHWSLPRKVPRALSFGITRLILHDILFKTFHNLGEMVDELSSLRWFRGTSLAWPQVAPSIASLMRYTRRAQIREVHCHLVKTTAYWPALVLSGRLVGPAEDRQCILKLAQALEESLEDVQDAVVTAASGADQSGVAVHWKCERKPFSLTFEANFALQQVEGGAAPNQAGEEPRQYLHKLRIEDWGMEREKFLGLNWDAVDREATSLEHLEKLEILLRDGLEDSEAGELRGIMRRKFARLEEKLSW